uniref:Uncharacterized protein n=1 Tax=Arundo donax TaxID=35708 RepID=A0A0A9HNM9_ARUDO
MIKGLTLRRAWMSMEFREDALKMKHLMAVEPHGAQVRQKNVTLLAFWLYMVCGVELSIM